MTNLADNWTPSSWREKPLQQGVAYPDAEELKKAVHELSLLPPLVTSWEVETLKDQLAEAAEGKRFILQGGDCAESFADCRAEPIAAKLKILLQMSFVMTYGGHRKITRIGRFAGQYAKPRSSDTETKDDVTLLSYRGDLINRPEFTIEAREPNPGNLLRGYKRAALTLNFIRSLVDGGFADLHHPEQWNLAFVDRTQNKAGYRQMIDEMIRAVGFLEAVTDRRLDELKRLDFFSSHEGLILEYEEAQTRQVPRRKGWYNLATHLPWIGERTRSLDGAHVEYFRGITNPIGVKLGPKATPEEVVELTHALNPENEAGRLMLIHRFGVENVGACLPPFVEAVRKNNRKVTWCCDPMHGNTQMTEAGLKTRNFEYILGELNCAFDIHREMGSILGGVHFELTGEDVTECTGGSCGLTEADLAKSYRTDLDPRLNYEQALEMALLVAKRVQRGAKR